MAESAGREVSDTVRAQVERRATVGKSLRLKVVTPERVVFEGSARSLVAPAWDGWVGILPGHAPFLTLMGEGPLSVEPESGDRLEFLVAGSPQPAGGSRERTAGVMKVESDEVTVLADRVGIPSKNAGTERSGDSAG